jgi:hypothetical protein
LKRISEETPLHEGQPVVERGADEEILDGRSCAHLLVVFDCLHKVRSDTKVLWFILAGVFLSNLGIIKWLRLLWIEKISWIFHRECYVSCRRNWRPNSLPFFTGTLSNPHPGQRKSLSSERPNYPMPCEFDFSGCFG